MALRLACSAKASKTDDDEELNTWQMMSGQARLVGAIVGRDGDNIETSVFHFVIARLSSSSSFAAKITKAKLLF